MKKIILLIITTTIISFSFSQDFVKEGKQWNVSEEINFGGTWTKIFKIEGDSVSNNLDYKKVWVSYDSTFFDYYYYGLIREDNKKVYFQYIDSDNEGLLYDFNISIGDTVRIISLPYDDVCEVELICSDIDTNTYLGTPRKRWVFGNYGEEYWVKDIGSLYGLFQTGYYQCIIDMYYSLLCCYEEDSLIYVNPDGYPCYLNTVDVYEHSIEAHILVTPNPIQQNRSIQITSTVQISQIRIFTIDGKTIKQFNKQPDNKWTIVTDGLKQGIYLLEIKTEGNSVVIKKLIVN